MEGGGEHRGATVMIYQSRFLSWPRQCRPVVENEPPGLTLADGWIVRSEQDEDPDCFPADMKAIAARGGDMAIRT